MQTRDFCFWLQGLIEVGKIETLDAEQVELIKAHLDLVFKHDANIKTEEMRHPYPNIATLQPRPITQYQHGLQGQPYMGDLLGIATC